MHDFSSAGPGRAALWLPLLLLLAACAGHDYERPFVIHQDAHSGGSIVAFNQAGDVLASGGWEGTLRLWQLPGGQALHHWPAHTDSVNGIVFIEDDRQLVTAGYDGVLARWSLDGALIKRIKTAAPVMHMVADRTRRRLITGHDDGSVRIWSLPDLELIKRACPVPGGREGGGDRCRVAALCRGGHAWPCVCLERGRSRTAAGITAHRCLDTGVFTGRAMVAGRQLVSPVSLEPGRRHAANPADGTSRHHQVDPATPARVTNWQPSAARPTVPCISSIRPAARPCAALQRMTCAGPISPCRPTGITWPPPAMTPACASGT